MLIASDCLLSIGGDALPVEEIIVVPSVVEISVGGLAGVEAVGRDRFGGRVDVRVRWTSSDTAVVTASPRFGSNTVLYARRAGLARVVATHSSSGARDTVEVTVPGVALSRPGATDLDPLVRPPPPRQRATP